MEAEATNGHHEMTPVLAASEARVIEPVQQPALPAPVVAAAGGAVISALTYMLFRVLRRPARRGAAIRVGRRGRRGRAIEITGSRSFLVDVHMLKR
jgi:hypothetical protein